MKAVKTAKQINRKYTTNQEEEDDDDDDDESKWTDNQPTDQTTDRLTKQKEINEKAKERKKNCQR